MQLELRLSVVVLLHCKLFFSICIHSSLSLAAVTWVWHLSPCYLSLPVGVQRHSSAQNFPSNAQEVHSLPTAWQLHIRVWNFLPCLNLKSGSIAFKQSAALIVSFLSFLWFKKRIQWYIWFESKWNEFVTSDPCQADLRWLQQSRADQRRRHH